MYVLKSGIAGPCGNILRDYQTFEYPHPFLFPLIPSELTAVWHVNFEDRNKKKELQLIQSWLLVDCRQGLTVIVMMLHHKSQITVACSDKYVFLAHRSTGWPTRLGCEWQVESCRSESLKGQCSPSYILSVADARGAMVDHAHSPARAGHPAKPKSTAW